VWGLDFEVRVMENREICAEKIRAMSDRARYRDFYDLFLLTEQHNLDLIEIVSFIGKKEIRKPITKTSILQNWVIVSMQKDAEMDQIYYSEKIDSTQIEDMIRDLPIFEISSSERSA